jgi:hypothetical protein
MTVFPVLRFFKKVKAAMLPLLSSGGLKRTSATLKALLLEKRLWH